MGGKLSLSEVLLVKTSMGSRGSRCSRTLRRTESIDDTRFHAMCREVLANGRFIPYAILEHMRQGMRYIESSRICPLADYERRELEYFKQDVRTKLAMFI